MPRSGLHAALLLAVEVLRERSGIGWERNTRLRAANTIRDFLGRKRLASKVSMRKARFTRRR